MGRHNFSRGAAFVVAVTTVTMIGGAITIARADLSSGDRSVLVPIAPCRLFDTRTGADNVGTRATPLRAGETFVQAVRGTNGKCTVPTDATAVALNVTAVNSTADSYLTVFPADVAAPLASNLNWRAGAAPTPNKVDVKLSVDGMIGLFNLAGQVDVIADVVGFYVPHNHDDRYYTKADVDAAVASRAAKPSGSQTLVIDASAFQPLIASLQGVIGFIMETGQLSSSDPEPTCVIATVTLPDAVTITEVAAQVSLLAKGRAWIRLLRNPVGVAPPIVIADSATPVASLPIATTTSTRDISSPLVHSQAEGYFVTICGMDQNMRLSSATITYLHP
jgi:hypothetical protein